MQPEGGVMQAWLEDKLAIIHWQHLGEYATSKGYVRFSICKPCGPHITDEDHLLDGIVMSTGDAEVETIGHLDVRDWGLVSVALDKAIENGRKVLRG